MSACLRAQRSSVIRSGFSDPRNILASKLCAVVFEIWEAKFGMVGLHANVKKMRTAFFLSCLEAQFCDFKGFFGNFDRD